MTGPLTPTEHQQLADYRRLIAAGATLPPASFTTYAHLVSREATHPHHPDQPGREDLAAFTAPAQLRTSLAILAVLVLAIALAALAVTAARL